MKHHWMKQNVKVDGINANWKSLWYVKTKDDVSILLLFT